MITRTLTGFFSKNAKLVRTSPPHNLPQMMAVSMSTQNKSKKDLKQLTRWLDVSAVKRVGKSFDGVFESQPLNNKHTVDYFPPIKGFSLNHKDVVIPDDYKGDVKLVVFSFQEYGFELVRKWLNPFLERFATELNNKSIVALEISFVEFSFLSIAKKSFANGIKTALGNNRLDETAVTFGGVMVS